MADREIHTHTTTGGGSGVGMLGVIIGALLVIGAIVFFTGGFNVASNEGGGGTSVTINAPEAPKAPAAPGGPATTGAR